MRHSRLVENSRFCSLNLWASTIVSQSGKAWFILPQAISWLSFALMICTRWSWNLAFEIVFFDVPTRLGLKGICRKISRWQTHVSACRRKSHSIHHCHFRKRPDHPRNHGYRGSSCCMVGHKFAHKCRWTSNRKSMRLI